MPRTPHIPGRLRTTRSTHWQALRRSPRWPPSPPPPRCPRSRPNPPPPRCPRSTPIRPPRPHPRWRSTPRRQCCLGWPTSPQRCPRRRTPSTRMRLPCAPSSQLIGFERDGGMADQSTESRRAASSRRSAALTTLSADVLIRAATSVARALHCGARMARKSSSSD